MHTSLCNFFIQVREFNYLSIVKQRPPFQAALEKIILSYENVYGNPVNEETILSKCRSAIDCIEKAEREIGADYGSGT